MVSIALVAVSVDRIEVVPPDCSWSCLPAVVPIVKLPAAVSNEIFVMAWFATALATVIDVPDPELNSAVSAAAGGVSVPVQLPAAFQSAPDVPAQVDVLA